MVDTNSLIPVLALTGMVSSNTGLPDPDNPNDELRVSNEDVILVTDDDDDSDEQETVLLDEYQLLPADEEAADANHGYGSSEDEASGQPADNPEASDNGSIPLIIPMEEVLVREVWSGPHSKIVDIEMDSKKVDEVKEVMANITLPTSSIPEWATNIPEEEWKTQLLKRLQKLQGEKK